VCVCLSVFLSACLSVCLSGYTFPQFSTDLLQIWREPSTGHDTFRGLYSLCVRARMCAFAYFWTDYVQIKYFLFSRTARVIKRPLLYGRILFKFAVNILHVSWHVAWAIYVVCARTACTRASARVRPSAWLNIHLSMDRRFSNLRWTYYKSQQVVWAMYFSWSLTAHTRANKIWYTSLWPEFTPEHDQVKSCFRSNYFFSIEFS
jgi:hypothetical protein